MPSPSFQAIALPGVPMVKQGDDIPQLILDALNHAGLQLQSNDVIVIASKIISKSEGRTVLLDDVVPGDEARKIAAEVDKDPRVIELVLSESTGISRMRKGVIVTEHRLGFVSANSGIDASNVDDSNQKVLLLPLDPDKTAAEIRQSLREKSGIDLAVVITDTHGRPFRSGNVGVAIGVSGMQAVWDRRGESDLFGREMVATILGYADLVASAAHLIMGEGSEGLPLVLVRGLNFPQGEGQAKDLNRPPEMDLYR